MTHYHAVVWIDHREAKIFHFNADDAERLRIRSDNPNQHLHHKAGSISGKHSPEDHHFLQQILDHVKDAQEFLVVGPGAAKLELVKYVHSHAPKLASHLIGVETLDHPSDGELLRYARRYSKTADRFRPQMG